MNSKSLYSRRGGPMKYSGTGFLNLLGYPLESPVKSCDEVPKKTVVPVPASRWIFVDRDAN